MILYFSGTGNSAYAAKYIGGIICDDVVDLFGRIKNKVYSEMTSAKPWVIAAPIYCWQIPRILEDWIVKTEFDGSRDAYFILTCGADIGNAEKYLKRLCAQKNLNYKGCAEIVMPENYIALFETPGKSEAKRIIKKAEHSLRKTAGLIQSGTRLPARRVKLISRLCSGIVNTAYYSLIVKDRKFFAEDGCNACGLCVKKCPLNNISLEDGKPRWHGDCTHCMACISHCPKEAIEYGSSSKGKERYICPEPSEG